MGGHFLFFYINGGVFRMRQLTRAFAIYMIAFFVMFGSANAALFDIVTSEGEVIGESRTISSGPDLVVGILITQPGWCFESMTVEASEDKLKKKPKKNKPATFKNTIELGCSRYGFILVPGNYDNKYLVVSAEVIEWDYPMNSTTADVVVFYNVGSYYNLLLTQDGALYQSTSAWSLGLENSIVEGEEYSG